MKLNLEQIQELYLKKNLHLKSYFQKKLLFWGLIFEIST